MLNIKLLHEKLDKLINDYDYDYDYDEVKKSSSDYMQDIVYNYIANKVSLLDIISKEAPTNTRIQDDIKTAYNILSLNMENTDCGSDVSEVESYSESDIEPIDENYTLRDELQTKYIDDTITNLDINKRVILKAPTGFGKTIINYKIIKHYKEDITLVLTPRRVLNSQTIERYIEYDKELLFAYYNYSPDNSNCINKFKQLLKFIKINKKLDKKIILIACYPSCKNLLNKLEKRNIKIGLVICDEAHVISSWSELSKECHQLFFGNDANKFKIFDKYIFTTATPMPIMIDNIPLFGQLIEHVQIYELINSQILCDFNTIIKHIDYAQNNIELADFILNIMQIYNKKKGIIYVNSQKNACNMYSRFKVKYPDYKTFIYISDKLTQETFSNSSNEEYKKVVFSEDDTKEPIFKKCKEPCIIITCNKISYGYDDVNIDLVCFGDPRQSDTEIRQIVGRGLRNKILEYPNKLLHIILPIANIVIENNDAGNDAGNDETEYEKIKNFISFIVNECGKDIIEGRINNSINSNRDDDYKPDLLNGKSYIGDKIPFQICQELCTTLYNKYTAFLGYLRLKGVYDETTYNNFRESEGFPEWIPILGDIRKRFKNFCFKELNAPENAEYYETLEECNEAYSKCLSEIAKPYGNINKLKAKKTEHQINKKIFEIDAKIPKNKELYYNS
jgi:superfamily II DNA or RNA helicase